MRYVLVLLAAFLTGCATTVGTTADRVGQARDEVDRTIDEASKAGSAHLRRTKERLCGKDMPLKAYEEVFPSAEDQRNLRALCGWDTLSSSPIGNGSS